MKKNKMMRIASVLLVAVLLSTCAISGTFAKYVTTASDSDEARVAKWGFEADENSIVLDDLFKSAYEYDDVLGAGQADVIAPGTSNSVDFSFEYDNTSNNVGAPEVDYTFVVEANITTTADADVVNTLDENPNFYWTLDGTRYDTMAELESAIESLDGNADKYEAGTLPEAFYGTANNLNINGTHSIGWVWDFETADDEDTSDGSEKKTQDDFDTAMGNADVLESITIEITVTATQVNETAPNNSEAEG